MSHRHTAANVEAITGTGKRQTLFDSEVRNLYLRVNANATDKTWYVQTRTGDGKRRHYRVGPANVLPPSEARKRALAKLREANEGDDLNARKRTERLEAVRSAERTLRKFIEGPYDQQHLSHRPSGEATKARLLAVWSKLLDLDMRTITVPQVHALRAARLKDNKKPQTVNRDVVALKAVLSKAVEWELLDVHPLARLKRLPVEDDKRTRYLTEPERGRLLAALRDKKTPKYLRSLVLVALNTGLRRGELFGLRWTDIKGGVLHVAAATSKMRKSRHVPLNAHALAALAEWRRERGNVIKLDGLVWTSMHASKKNPEGGGRFNNFKRSWKTLLKRAKIAGFTFHDCRHDFASRLVQAGTDLYVVQRLLGHGSGELTQRYAHLAPDNLARAVATLG